MVSSSPALLTTLALTSTMPSAAYSTDDILIEGGKVQYSYYRADNFHQSAEVGASSGSARAVSWNYTYTIFDSTKDTYVMRYDVAAGPSPVTLGGNGTKQYLAFPNAFLFTTSPSATITDAKTGKSRSFAPNSMAYVNSGACVSLSMEPSSSSPPDNVTLMVVTAGPFDPTAFISPTSSCEALNSLVGYDELHNNPVDYVSNGTCLKALGGPGGAPDYDNLDDPIRPLQAHYHTRGALYYTASGTSLYDTGVPGLAAGELRFVNEGYYYGPETMDPWPGAVVLSLHEPDADAIANSAAATKKQPKGGYTPCTFACLDTPEQSAGRATLRCLAP